MEIKEYTGLTPEIREELRYLLSKGYDEYYIKPFIDLYGSYISLIELLKEVNYNENKKVNRERKLIFIVRTLIHSDDHFKSLNSKELKTKIKYDFNGAADDVIQSLNQAINSCTKTLTMIKDYRLEQKNLLEEERYNEMCKLFCFDASNSNNSERDL